MGKKSKAKTTRRRAILLAGTYLVGKKSPHSILSFFSVGSIGSSGSILSIGSAGSILGLGSAGYSPFREREDEEGS